MIKAVYFDVGETLIDETRDWGIWADKLGIPRLTFFAALGAIIERDLEHAEIFRLFGVEAEARRLQGERKELGWGYRFEESDLYPDVRPCLLALREAGYYIGIAGNQPTEALAALQALALPIDFIATSTTLGASKPDIAFFENMLNAAGNFKPAQALYVGDRFDKDVYPAQAAGLHAVRIRRGPWGWIQRGDDPAHTIMEITALGELAEALVHIASRA